MSLNDAIGALIVLASVVMLCVFTWGCINMDKQDPDWWRH